MTEEASAVVRGLLSAEPDVSVVVCDAHAGFRNLLPDQLPRRCRLIQGHPRRHGMLAGIDGGIDAVLLVGYHGAAGTGCSVLAHTASGGTIAQVRCDGVAIGEIGLGVRLASHYGASTILASGDDTACAEAEKEAPGIATVAVKRALGSAIGRAELLAGGVVIVGPAPEQLLPPVTRAALDAAVRSELAGYWSGVVRQYWVWLNDWCVDLGVITLPRARAALSDGRLITKSEAIDRLKDSSVPDGLVDEITRRRNGETVRLSTIQRLRRARVARRVVTSGIRSLTTTPR